MTPRIRPRDWVLIVALTGAWAMLFARAVDEGLRTGQGRFCVSVSSAAAADGYPTLSETPLACWNQGLQPGDEILSIASEDLAGRTSLHFYDRAMCVAREQGFAPLRVRRAGATFEARIEFTPTAGWWQMLASAAAVMLTSLLLWVRAPGWHLARRVFIATCCVSLQGILAPRLLAPASFPDGLLLTLVLPLGLSLTVWSAQEFTLSARPVPWTHRALAVLVFFLVAAELITLHFLPYWGVSINALTAASGTVFVAACVAGLTRAYVRSEPLERRQLRWVMLGAYVSGAALLLTLTVIIGLNGDPPVLMWALLLITYLGVTVGILVSVIGYGWLDVDRLISATASYTIVGLAVLGAALALIPRVAHAAASVVGLDASTGQWALTMGLVGAAIPVHRFLRPRIDRRLFAARHERMRGFERLLDEIGRSTSVEALMRLPGERMDALLEPESIAIYGREESLFTPLFVRGRAAPPAFETDSPLLHTLARRSRPLAVGTAELDPFDRAALETLGVSVVVPTRRGETVVAFTCLGPKRSGDIYTPEEIAYLTAVAKSCSEVLVKLEGEVVIREARELQRSLRRYVPGAVAEELAGGRDLESAEREVSVLFVDMRGYTSFSERRAAEEIFSTLNAYTEKVSAIVREHGGSVVEFHGDGLQAVFGAPHALERKERAAVEAGREVVEALAGKIEVGIGIATGPSYVGNIRAADRLIWTAVGNTTNLAARLQALTRELEAAIAIDAATHAAAGYVCADFVRHPEVRIRGRTEPQDVWALPLRCPS